MTQTFSHTPRAVVIGAGIGGLCSTARLQAAGYRVSVLEKQNHPGGKIRTITSDSGPVDAGPTVLTLKHVFEDVFDVLGEKLDEHLDLARLPVIARHFWPDGSTLDLHDTPNMNSKAILDFAGPKAAREFETFQKDAEALFKAFDRPMMASPSPSMTLLATTIMRQPSLLSAMAPWRSLEDQLAKRFSDPRLVQLFGRYATYVGGVPHLAPALLGLIWQAEAAGVWAVKGGMQRLPAAIEALCKRHGVRFRYDCPVASITVEDGVAKGVHLKDGSEMRADLVVFNGDPRALATGALGPTVTCVAPQTRTAKRSSSAIVWSFDAVPKGLELSHHNVFFAKTPGQEFRKLGDGKLPQEQSIYVCAQDRGPSDKTTRGQRERFEIILNAPPLGAGLPPDTEFHTCQKRTFDVLRRFGLSFDPPPGPQNLSRPDDFAKLFPASLGSLYGQSPHGLTASLDRPRARTPIKGLYLAGGGTHPGAGLPMAALSARHAVETIMTDRTLPSRSRQTDMHGGMLTELATIKKGPSRS